MWQSRVLSVSVILLGAIVAFLTAGYLCAYMLQIVKSTANGFSMKRSGRYATTPLPASADGSAFRSAVEADWLRGVENQVGYLSGVCAGSLIAGDGLEVDVYGGWGGSTGDFSYGVGVTGYYYTGEFDDTYQEINLGGGFAGLSLDVAIGRYDNFDGPTQDYTFAALTFEHRGFYGTYGTFSQDFDGSYIELGYGTTISEIDFGVALILAASGSCACGIAIVGLVMRQSNGLGSANRQGINITIAI